MGSKVLLYTVISMLLTTGLIALWTFVRKRKTQSAENRKRTDVCTGIVFGIHTVLCSLLFDWMVSYGDGTAVFADCGLSILCAGLSFGGTAALISAGIGTVFELLSFFVSGRLLFHLADAVCILAAGLNIWAVDRYVLRGKKASASMCALLSLAFSSFNITAFMISELVLRGSFLSVTGRLVTVMFGAGLLVTEASQFMNRKIETGEFYRNSDSIAAAGKLKAAIVIPLTVFIIVMTVFMYQYLTAALWGPVCAWAADDLKIISKLVREKPDRKTWQPEEIPEGYYNGTVLIAEKDGTIICGNAGGAGTLQDAGIFHDPSLMEGKGYPAKINGEDCIWIFADTGPFLAVEFIPGKTVFAARMPLMLLAVCAEIILFYLVILAVILALNRLFLDKAQETLELLEQIMGRRNRLSEEREYHPLSASVVRDLKDAAGRITDEMAFAGNVQMQSLPVNELMTKGIGIHALIKPARQVGGDFYDYFQLDGSRWLFLTADVSGKGLSAAMFMMKARAAVRSFACEEADLETLLMKVNEELCSGNTDQMFVAMWIGILDTESGTVSYVNSAMGNQILKEQGKEYRLLEDKSEAPLGVKPGKRYTVRKLALKPGSRLLLYTDGVSEANNEKEEMYSDQRLLDFLNAGCRLTGGADTLHMVGDDLKEFAGRAEQFDDITMLEIDYFGQADRFKVRSKTFPAEDKYLDEAAAFINDSLRSLSISAEQEMEIDVAFEELFVNVSHYAYPDGVKDVTVEVSTDHSQAMIRLTDSGIPFDPLRHRKPEKDIPLQERKEGGLGIVMVKACMNYVEYEYSGEKNRVTMIKTVI